MRPIAALSAGFTAFSHKTRFLLLALVVSGLAPAAPAQTSPIAGKAPGLLETGIPAFVVLGPEALGLATAPVDLQRMPDGRLLVIAHGELAFGDGVRWDIFRQMEDDPHVDTAGVAVDQAGRIYAGVPGGIARIDFAQDGRWHFVLQEKAPAEIGPAAPPLINTSAVGDEWFWWWGSGPVVAWHPGTRARLVGRANAVENVFSLGRDVHLSDQSTGALFRLEDGTFQPAALPNSKYVDSTITSAVPLDDGRTLLGTVSQGVLLYDGASLQQFKTSGLLSGEHRINDICATGGGLYAAALDNVGIVFFDLTGRTVQVLPRTVDHRLSRARRLLRAPGGIMWALLNEGIARIEFPSRVSSFEPLVSTGLAFSQPFRYQGRLWLMSDGRAQRGIYDGDNRLVRFEVDTPGPYLTSMVELDGSWHATTFDGIFRHEPAGGWTLLARGPISPHVRPAPVEPGPYLTSMVELDGSWHATTFDGIFRHEPAGGWTLLARGPVSPHVRPAPVEPGRWLYAAENETGWLHRTGEAYEFERFPVPGMGHAYGALADARGVFWVELGNAKVARIAPTQPQPTVETLGRAEGVPEGWAQLFNIDGTVRLNAPPQILRFDETTRRFVPDTDLMQKLPALNGAIGRPATDANSRLWVATTDKVRVVDPRAPPSTESLETIPEGLRPLYFTPQSDGVVWMNQRMRVARFDPSLPLSESIPLRALITRVEFPSSKRVLYSVGREMPPVPAWDNSLAVHFLAPDSPFGQPVSFEIKLDGVSSGWVSAGNSGSMTFNHLSPGPYLLHVRPRIGSQPGAEATLAFTILTPWYRTRAAYVAYVLGGIAIVGFAGWLSLYFSRREKALLEHLVARRTRQLNTTNQELELQIQESINKTNALRASEDRYRRLSDNAPDIIFRLNIEPAIAYDYVSPAITRIAGYQPGEFLADARFIQKIAHPPGSETIYELASAKRVPQEVRQACWRTRDGRIVTIEERLSAIRDDTGRLVAIEGIARDITQSIEEQERRRRLEAQLLQSQKLESVGTLAGGIAHDFNNILTGILGYCELAAMSAADDPALLEDLRQIRAAGLRAKELVAQILTFSRKGESKLVPVNLASVVGEALKLVRATTPATIRIMSDCAAGTVLADATQIHQIVINLCTNGIHAMRENAGQLSVSVQPVEPDSRLTEEIPNLPAGLCLRLTVSDTGRGMDEATLARVFDPFFTTKKPGEGTGLGLSIVQGIVANHHGGLRVRSQVGAGTTFDIYLPLSQEAVAAAAPAAPVNRGRQQSILVVDDEAAVAGFVAAVLQRFDYQTTVLHDPRSALLAVAAEPGRFHAIVTDMTMPHLTGLELVQQIRAKGIALPTIITSGYSRELAELDATTLPHLAILTKPFDGQDLARALSQLLEVH